ncbi:MAG: TonB-dependent receptor [Alphaproteobacteria bacterium]|nr:TonB-dependent receptor [Alphaproteobacteria bacterium]
MRNLYFSTCTLCLFAGAVGLGIAGSAQAAVDEIIVTAQKREESLQDVPISITALSGDFIERTGIPDFETLAFYVPNFQYTTSNQLINTRIGIRGVNSVGNSGFETSVGVFIDDVYVPRPGATIGTLMDLQAVEILRGPQGTLYGRNTSVGALNVRSRAPTSDLQAGLRLFGGDIDGYGAAGYVSGPIANELLGRFAFHVQDRAAYLENTFENEDELDRQDYNFRGRLSWTPVPELKADFIVDYQLIDYNGANVEIAQDSITSQFLTTFATIHGVTVDTGSSFDQKVKQVHTDTATQMQYGISLKVDYEIFDHTLTSITSYRNWEDNYRKEEVVRLPAEVLFRDRVTTTDNYSEELRLSSATGGMFEYIGGLFFYHEEYDTDTFFDLGADYCNDVLPAIGQAGLVAACNAAPERATIDDFGQQLTSIAAFGSLTWNLTDAFKLTGGLRWTRDEKEGFFTRRRLNAAAAPIAPTGTVGSNLGVEQIDERVTYSLTGRYFVTPEVMAFATVATGFKSGGLNSEAQAITLPRTFGPEFTQDYELGLKSTLFDRRLRANLTLFHMDIDDFQERTFTGLGFIVGNAGSVRQRGLELDLDATPVDELSLNLGFAWLDSEFTDFRGAPGLPGGAAQNLTGKRRPDSPEFTVSLGAQWTDRIPNTDLGWFVRGEYQWTDEQYLAANLNPQALQEAYTIVNFRAGISGEDKSWTLSAFVRNAFDEGYCTRLFDQVLNTVYGAQNAAAGTSVQRCVVGTPRNFGGELSVKF